MNAKAQAIGKKIGKKVRGFKDRVINTTANVLAARPLIKAHNAKRVADYETDIIDKHRRIKKHGTGDRRPPVDPNSDARLIIEYNRIKDRHKR